MKTETVFDGAIRAMTKWADAQIAAHVECLDRDDPRRCSKRTFTPIEHEGMLRAVDLEIAHSPIVPPSMFWPRRCDPTTDGKWMIYDYQPHPACNMPKHSWGYDTETIRRYRLRFLVLRDAIYQTMILQDFRLFPELSRYSSQIQVLPAFGLHWIPDPNGGLGKKFRTMFDKNNYVYQDGTIDQ